MMRLIVLILASTLTLACGSAGQEPEPTSTGDVFEAPAPARPASSSDAPESEPESEEAPPSTSSPAEEPPVATPPPSSTVGDGICNGNETFASAPQDCPPPNVTFAGGTITQLAARSPSLHFGDLVITGQLTIPTESVRSEVTLTVDNLHLAPGGSIRVDFDTCDYDTSPSLSIVASGDVIIEGFIDLHGRNGERTAADSDCKSCYGSDGGDLTVVAHTIIVRADLRTHGGGGSRWSDVFNGQLVYFGCRGGDGGDVVLDAEVELRFEGGKVKTNGADGGLGTYDLTSDDGVDGAIVWQAPSVTVHEVEHNGTLGLAQPLPLSPLTLHGNISADDDAIYATAGDMRQATFSDRPSDRIEDMFRVIFSEPTARTVQITLETAPSRADLDLYVIDAAGERITAMSIGPTSNEEVQIAATPGTVFFVGVTMVGRSTPTDYLLRFE